MMYRYLLPIIAPVALYTQFASAIKLTWLKDTDYTIGGKPATIEWDGKTKDATIYLYKGSSAYTNEEGQIATSFSTSWTITTLRNDPGVFTWTIGSGVTPASALTYGVDYWFWIYNNAGAEKDWTPNITIHERVAGSAAEPTEASMASGLLADATATDATPGETASGKLPFATSSSTPSSTPGSTPTNTGAIIGGVVGGIALVGFLIIAAIYVWRRGSSNEARHRKVNDADEEMPYPPGAPAGLEVYDPAVSEAPSYRTGGVIGSGGAIYPITEQLQAQELSGKGERQELPTDGARHELA